MHTKYNQTQINWCWYPQTSMNLSIKRSYGESLAQMLGLSKSKLKKLIGAKKFHKVMEINRECQEEIGVINEGKVNGHYTGKPIEIILENKYFYAINKPWGVHSHPLRYSDTNSVVNFLVNHRAACDQINKESYDRGLINRLDFATSGLMLFAKEERVYQKLRAKFSDIVRHKKYWALIDKPIKTPEHLEHYLYQKPGAPKVVVKVSDDVQFQRVDLKILSCTPYEQFWQIEIELAQGLRHQIRAQLAAAGYPIIGDTLYGGRKWHRLALHAYHYDLGEWGKYDAPVDWSKA